MKYTFKKERGIYGQLGFIIQHYNNDVKLIITVYKEIFYVHDRKAPINKKILSMIQKAQEEN